MKVLVACEFSGIVRDAFTAKGHDAWSCDLLPTERPGKHIQADVMSIYKQPWDLMIAHPPCTYLAVSGARWWAENRDLQEVAYWFVMCLAQAPIAKIAIENPVGLLSTRWQRPTQIIQPWQFGHGETKKTCLWLKGLPRLLPTNIVSGRDPRVHWESNGPNRWKNRSRTYQGIANAMAEQWG